jgi:serine/threonine protein kinase
MKDPKISGLSQGSRDDLGIRSPQLNAKWRLDAVLGVGGMGAVYAATHRNGHRAAIKVLHQSLSSHPEARERFLREGRIANAVQHAARVAILDDDESDEGEAFLVMELLEGETLWSRLERKGHLDDGSVLEIFDTVLDLLVKCHAAQILHRDLKPDNIFLTRDGQVKVLDFGVARLRESRVVATREGTALGTPSFMSPEQARGRHSELDGRSDVFSVGACMYMALTGEMLHASRNPMESLVFAGTRPAPSVALAGPSLSRDVVALVDRAIAFERDARYADAHAMLVELRRIRNAHRGWAEAEVDASLRRASRSSQRMAIDARVDTPPVPTAAPPSARAPGANALPKTSSSHAPSHSAPRTSSHPADSSYRIVAPRSLRKSSPARTVDPATPRITHPVPFVSTQAPMPRRRISTPALESARPGRTAVYPRPLAEPPNNDAGDPTKKK